MNITCIFEDEAKINKRPNGVYPVDIPKCVRVEDKETGLIVISTKGRSQLENRNKALDVLTCWKMLSEDNSYHAPKTN